MEELTPEQKKQLSSWVSQRDALLQEISILRTENEKLTLENKNLAQSYTRTIEDINRSLGRIEELNKKEKEFDTLVGVENAELTSRKDKLETKIAELEKQVLLLEENKKLQLQITQTAINYADSISSKANTLDKVVGHVVAVSSNNVRELDALLASMRDSVQKVLDLNEENVKKANYVIEELPRLFFDLQRKSLIRPKI